MNIKLPDHGRSILDQLLPGKRDKTGGLKKNDVQQKLPGALKDIYEKSADLKTTKKEEKEKNSAADTKDGAAANTIKEDGLNISFQFDLFYELTSKVEARMGQSGADRFVELSGKVSETFMGSFNLSIDAVGSFMNGTDKSLDISPETTSQFFDAVEGLADLSPEALENFLKESDEFFASLEDTYGEANGAFAKIKDQMQAQAKSFFANVEKARTEAVSGIQSDMESAKALATPESAPGTADVDAVEKPAKRNSLIELFFQPGKKASQEDYKSFLEDFADYAMKFRQQMFEKLLGSKVSGYDKMLKAGEEKESASKSIIDTAV